ncbi:MAG: hypothetical protein WCH34_05820 [Bacteroidota bacterium]
MKRFLFILIFLLFSFSSYSQTDFGIKLNGGFSKITATRYNSSNFFDQWPLSWQGGLYYNVFIFKRIFIGVETVFNQMQGKEKTEYPNYDNGILTKDSVVINTSKSVSFIGNSINIGYKYKRFTLSFGFQYSFTIASNVNNKISMPFSGSIINLEFDKKQDVYDKLVTGLKAGIYYDLTKRFSIEGAYYHGLRVFYNTEPDRWNGKFRQMTIGIRFKINRPIDKK